MSESICSIGSWSRRLGPSDFTGYGASAIRTDGSPSRGLRPACGGLFPCRGDKRLGRDHPRNSATAEPDTVDLLAREQSHHARASPPRVTGRAAVAFVPPGAQGIAMSTWLSGVGATPVPLVGDARRGLGLRQMEAALASGKDVLIAVDGPTGPRHGIAPGALWLADVEIRPAGCWASPALRLPRWDRLMVPLPAR